MSDIRNLAWLVIALVLYVAGAWQMLLKATGNGGGVVNAFAYMGIGHCILVLGPQP